MNRAATTKSLLATKQPTPWSRQQLILNIGSNAALFLLNFGVNLWFVPYLIRHLGVAGYGVVPLTATFSAYLGLITLSLNSALGRFLTIDLERGDLSSANRTFNTAFFVSLMLCGVIVAISFGIVAVVPRLFNLPQGREFDAQLLFVASALAFMVTTVESSFSVSSWSRNRFDWFIWHCLGYLSCAGGYWRRGQSLSAGGNSRAVIFVFWCTTLLCGLRNVRRGNCFVFRFIGTLALLDATIAFKFEAI